VPEEIFNIEKVAETLLRCNETGPDEFDER